MSYISVIVFATLGVLCYVDLINTKVMNAVVISSTVLILLSQLVIVMINDIGFHRDEKKKFYLENGERKTIPPTPESLLPKDNKLMSKVIQHSMNSRNNACFTMCNLWDSYHVRLKKAGKGIEKRNKVNLDYIEYVAEMRIERNALRRRSWAGNKSPTPAIQGHLAVALFFCCQARFWVTILYFAHLV